MITSIGLDRCHAYFMHQARAVTTATTKYAFNIGLDGTETGNTNSPEHRFLTPFVGEVIKFTLRNTADMGNDLEIRYKLIKTDADDALTGSAGPAEDISQGDVSADVVKDTMIDHANAAIAKGAIYCVLNTPDDNAGAEVQGMVVIRQKIVED